MCQLTRRPLFNPQGDTETAARRIINGNTTNLNDFNNMKYAWVSGWYRQAMNNFWSPEEINLAADVKDYPRLPRASQRGLRSLQRLAHPPEHRLQLHCRMR